MSSGHKVKPNSEILTVLMVVLPLIQPPGHLSSGRRPPCRPSSLAAAFPAATSPITMLEQHLRPLCRIFTVSDRCYAAHVVGVVGMDLEKKTVGEEDDLNPKQLNIPLHLH
ncbi:hypothetical protein L195_g022767 [Trifolium pratense]|uniref:Uncharacterized protein n=1 Tax=Trifolium pratense TaxID=57577 RepID=A0A2K3N8X6_TRIPR|nr:hypothetical protein L195_g022767 [Trifolium pratense]